MRSMTSRNRVLRGLLRILTNTVLLHLWAGGWILLLLVLASQVNPAVLGDFDVADSWSLLMLWLLAGAFVTIPGVAVLDVVLLLMGRRRQVATVVCLTPGLAIAILAVGEPALRGMSLFLLLTGLGFGLTVRMPPAREDSKPARPRIG